MVQGHPRRKLVQHGDIAGLGAYHRREGHGLCDHMGSGEGETGEGVMWLLTLILGFVAGGFLTYRYRNNIEAILDDLDA